jgi:surface antigen
VNAYPCLGVPADGKCPQTPTYPARECTSGCSYWGAEYTGKPWPTGWGDAMDWPAHARADGYDVDDRATPNSIMCIPPNTNGSGNKGHVAFVTGVTAQGAQVIELNFLIEHGYDFRTAPTRGCEYIHLVPAHPPQPDPPPTGGIPRMWLYQGTNGTIYLVAGNTLVALSNIADVEVFQKAGAPLIHQSSLTASAQADIAKLPKL